VEIVYRNSSKLRTCLYGVTGGLSSWRKKSTHSKFFRRLVCIRIKTAG